MNFLELVDSFRLQHYVRGSTHIRGHTRDLIIARRANTIIQSPPKADRYFSDQASIVCYLKAKKPVFTKKIVGLRKLKSINTAKLRDDLARSDLCSTD